MLTRICTLCALLLILTGEVYSQLSPLEASYEQYDQSYGLNQLLHNGQKYTPEHTLVKGHPFLFYDQFVEGKVMLKGKLFEPVMLKYDIYKQNFVLSFIDRNKATQQLVIPKLLIDSIWISHALFLNAAQFGMSDQDFVQVLSDDDLEVLYVWSKEYQFTATKNDIPHVYSDAKRTTYLSKNNQVLKYRTKGAFVKLFPEEWHKPIKNYIKQNKLRLKKANDSDMIGLLIFINSL